MSRSRCAGCPKLRALIEDPSISGYAQQRMCKHKRLCKRIDPGLIQRYPYQTLNAYEDMSRDILIGHARAIEMLRARPFPRDGKEFLAAALEAHRLTFENGDPSIAGQLRRHSVWYGRGGHGGPNYREGAPHQQLEELMLSFPLQGLPTTKREAGWWGADFLRRFFVIHPFSDGNGRVARLLMTRGIEDAGTLIVVGDHDRQSRRYLSCLEYAHRHAGRDSRKNCLLYLARYISELVITSAELGDLMEWADFEELGLEFDQELVPNEFVDDGDE